MKTRNIPINLPNINPSLSERRRIPATLVFTTILLLLTLSVKAGNILVNPSFDLNPLFASGSWSQNATVTWSMNQGTAWAPRNLTHSGANSLWMQGVYVGGGYAAQDFACFPGNSYTADCWYSAYTAQNGSIGGSGGGGSGLFANDAAGNEDGWIEVQFLGTGNTLLADYKSTIITPAFCNNAAATETLVTNAYGTYLPWQDFPVTNQYDVSTITTGADPALNGTITNVLGAGQVMVAPPGTVKVEFRVSMFQAQYEAGAPFYDDATLNQVGGPSQSVIGNLSPDGTTFFSTNANFTFNITSASAGGAPLPTNATSNVGIIVNGQNKTSSLQFSGPSTNLSVTLPGLATNTVYNISVFSTNSVGLTTSKSVSFDTFPANVFIVSAEDYDYTNGQFIENPTPTSAPAPNSYYGLAGTLGVDDSTYGGTGILPGNGASQLVRSDNNVAIQRAGDIQLPLYAAQNDPNVYNVQIAYNNAGNWENYTRSYPVGNYIVYMRYNNATAGAYESLNLVTSGAGTSSQTVTNLGQFIGAAIGANYAWVPLTDIYGNSVIFNLPAGQHTLQLLSGNLENFVDFIFVPASGTFPPVINNLNPNLLNSPINTNIFLQVTNITYSVSSHFSTVAQSAIHTVVNGVDISSKATYTGNNTAWNVSVPCPQNQLINLSIFATDATGASNTVSETFDTFSQSNYMVNAQDFDFNSGQFIDNPIPTAPLFLATNSYYAGGVDQANFAVSNIDYYGAQQTGAAFPYRPLDVDIGQEVTTDFLRAQFYNADGQGDNASDYDIGYWNNGFWENYTRTYPAGTYNVYARLAGGNGPFSGTTLSMVTAGRGTTSQTTKVLGTFADPAPAGWATWHWVPMMASNQLATITLGGVETLRLTSGNNLNAHFFMLVPATSGPPTLTVTVSGSAVTLHFPTVSGHNYTVLYNNTLGTGTWQPLSASIPGDGTVKTVPDTITGKTRFYVLQIQ
ncbi:MAG TPA: hypothetical protein VMH87_08575 [Pseudomonadales bacterium]|nr:hypothetical protein [Pseudomonadales bacterium]